jgi:hypothetical protein
MYRLYTLVWINDGGLGPLLHCCGVLGEAFFAATMELVQVQLGSQGTSTTELHVCGVGGERLHGGSPIFLRVPVRVASIEWTIVVEY